MLLRCIFARYLYLRRPNRIRLWFYVIVSIVIIVFLTVQKQNTQLSADERLREVIFSKNEPRSSNSVRCVVYMATRSGRLGNRMFMIASAYGLARLHACHLYFSTGIVEEMSKTFLFNLTSLLLSSNSLRAFVKYNENPVIRIRKLVICQYIYELTQPNAISRGNIFELAGFWQSYLHFVKYGDDLRQNIFAGRSRVIGVVSKFFDQLYQQKFDLKMNLSTNNHKTLKHQLASDNQTTWIGIHVRRSDFLKIGYSSSNEYLFTAVNFFIDQYPNAHFIVASDDKSYCQKLFNNLSNVFMTPSTFSNGEDLITLSLCEHSIVTGGTFGWWSSYLANGRVLHDSVYVSGCERREHYHPPWFHLYQQQNTTGR